VWRDARHRNLACASAEDLTMFLRAAEAVGDTNLKTELDGELAKLIPHPQPVDLGGQIRFLGWEIQRLTARRVRLDLYWLVLKAPAADYTVWVHVTPKNQALAGGQKDTANAFVSLDHALKTSGWQPGAVYHDTTEAELVPGEYALTLGLWRPEDGSRLWVDEAKGEHVVDVGKVIVR
jgi:hypothetical protein